MRDEAKERSELLLAIQDLGYESLRCSIFNEHRPGEWEVRIEFDDFNEAEYFFINKLEHFVESNRFKLKIGKKPYYSSPLWDKTDE